jgi:hypothetical protein
MPDFESGAFNRALPPLRYVFNSPEGCEKSASMPVDYPSFAA